MRKNIFEGRNLVIATMHGKENTIAPILEEALGVKCFTADTVNTDQLGTFTGEVERDHDPITTARLKCLLAIEQTEADLALASEGSFGSHPEVFFAKADDEIIYLLDVKNNIKIVGRKLSMETNFDGHYIQSWKEMVNFAEKSGFPSHGLILRKDEKSNEIFEKGIRSWGQLEALTNQLMQDYGKIWVETDMRAMHNPTRLLVIAEATKNLVENAKSHCPKCDFPGFIAHESITGLPCGLCHHPTRSIRALKYLCDSCGFESVNPRPDGKTEEDPMYCDFCNP
jgi:hypothetical protein